MLNKTICLVAGSLMVALVSGIASADPTDQQRSVAARRTVRTNPLCSSRILGPYYWEIGNQGGTLVSGSVSDRSGAPPIKADTAMPVASASKWIYAAYVVQLYGDAPEKRPFLNMTSGYSNIDLPTCTSDGTVATCDPGPIDKYEALHGVFHYDGGHMQHHAIDQGLGPLDIAGLAAEIGSTIGSDVAISFVDTGVAGGINTTARNYARFLRKLMAGSTNPLQLGMLLGSNPVCTYSSDTCNAAKTGAVPEAWHYSLGHWIEDDPLGTPNENFAYSSPGTLGFYPWIDTNKSLYGILARRLVDYSVYAGYDSAQCGRLIRLAWKTGTVQ